MFRGNEFAYCLLQGGTEVLTGLIASAHRFGVRWIKRCEKAGMPYLRELQYFSLSLEWIWDVHNTSLIIWISTDCVVLIDNKDRDPLKRLFITREVAQIVPTHRVDIRLRYLFRKYRMMSSEERIEIIIANK